MKPELGTAAWMRVLTDGSQSCDRFIAGFLRRPGPRTRRIRRRIRRRRVPRQHYSQYLSARAYSNFLRSRYPADSIWIFFGAGNVTGQRPIIADVIQTVQDEKGRKRTTFIPGALPDNRPARAEIARAFREEILPAVSDGGTLYLFVGDHGIPSGSHSAADDFPESHITLWELDRDPTHPYGWRSYLGPTESLGVAELRNWLSEGLGRGRVVFAMSQCYSCGFHHLGIPRELTPNSKWFTRTPDWVSRIRETDGMPQVAGFENPKVRAVAQVCELTYPPSMLDPNYEAPDPNPTQESDKTPARPARSIAAIRIQFYRQVLAAWDFLIAVNEREARACVKALTDWSVRPCRREAEGTTSHSA